MKTSIALLGALALASAANAQVVFSDNFDSYPNQAAFNAAWNVSVSGGGGIVSRDHGSSFFDQCIEQDLTGKASGKNFTATSGSDAQPLVWSFQFYDSTQTANLRQFASIRDNTPELAQLVAMGAYNDTTLTKNLFTGASVTAADLNTYYACRVAFGPGPNWFILNTEGVPTRSTGWHELMAVFGSTTADFYVDGVLGMADVPYAASAGALTFDRVTVGSGLSSANGVGYYDDVLVMVVPEPSALALSILGGFGLLVRRMRR